MSKEAVGWGEERTRHRFSPIEIPLLFLQLSLEATIRQLLKFPPNRLFVPDRRTAAAIRCRLSSTLPARDERPVSRAPVPGL